MMSSTRSKNLLWLLEKSPNPGFLVTRLPSREDVLLVFHYYLQEVVMEAAKSTSLKLHEVWEKENLPVKAEHVIRRNIRNLDNEYVSLKKEAKRETPASVTKREVWKGDLHYIFDIASGKIAETNVSEEDLAFLTLKMEDRQSCSMGSVNKLYASAVARKDDEKMKRKMRKKKQEAEVEKLFKKVALEEISDSSSVFS